MGQRLDFKIGSKPDNVCFGYQQKRKFRGGGTYKKRGGGKKMPRPSGGLLPTGVGGSPRSAKTGGGKK